MDMNDQIFWSSFLILPLLWKFILKFHVIELEHYFRGQLVFHNRYNSFKFWQQTIQLTLCRIVVLECKSGPGQGPIWIWTGTPQVKLAFFYLRKKRIWKKFQPLDLVQTRSNWNQRDHQSCLGPLIPGRSTGPNYPATLSLVYVNLFKAKNKNSTAYNLALASPSPLSTSFLSCQFEEPCPYMWRIRGSWSTEQ